MYDGQYFKDINSSNHTLTPYKVYKQWSYTPLNYLDNGVQLLYGTKMTTPAFSTSSAQNSDGSYKELVYAAINTRYYLQTGSYYLQTSKDVERKINNNIIYIGIPQQKYGEQIKPGTFELAYSNISITDDAKGNLIGTIDSTSSYVGNIFYTDGNAVITQTGSYFDDFDTGSFTQIAYQGQQTLYEHEYVVTINKGELNSSTNTSLFNPVSSNYWTSSNGSALIYTSESSEWSGSSIFDTEGFDPYITTIGLYNENDDCLIIARLAKPIKNDKNLNLSFKIRIDA